MSSIAEEQVSQSLSKIRAEYFTMVREHAESLAEDIKDRERFPNRESLVDRIQEDCNSHEWVIYTFKAQLVLMCSDNASAGIDSLGADGFDWSAGIPWSQLAYFAFQADLYESLDAAGVDLNDDDLGRGDAESDGAE